MPREVYLRLSLKKQTYGDDDEASTVFAKGSRGSHDSQEVGVGLIEVLQRGTVQRPYFGSASGGGGGGGGGGGYGYDRLLGGLPDLVRSPQGRQSVVRGYKSVVRCYKSVVRGYKSVVRGYKSVVRGYKYRAGD